MDPLKQQRTIVERHCLAFGSMAILSGIGTLFFRYDYRYDFRFIGSLRYDIMIYIFKPAASTQPSPFPSEYRRMMLLLWKPFGHVCRGTPGMMFSPQLYTSSLSQPPDRTLRKDVSFGNSSGMSEEGPLGCVFNPLLYTSSLPSPPYHPSFPRLNIAEGCWSCGNPSGMFAEGPLGPHPHRWRRRAFVARLPAPDRRHR